LCRWDPRIWRQFLYITTQKRSIFPLVLTTTTHPRCFSTFFFSYMVCINSKVGRKDRCIRNIRLNDDDDDNNKKKKEKKYRCLRNKYSYNKQEFVIHRFRKKMSSISDLNKFLHWCHQNLSSDKMLLTHIDNQVNYLESSHWIICTFFFFFCGYRRLMYWSLLYIYISIYRININTWTR
jgi:hypothetical protein